MNWIRTGWKNDNKSIRVNRTDWYWVNHRDKFLSQILILHFENKKKLLPEKFTTIILFPSNIWYYFKEYCRQKPFTLIKTISIHVIHKIRISKCNKITFYIYVNIKTTTFTSKNQMKPILKRPWTLLLLFYNFTWIYLSY